MSFSSNSPMVIGASFQNPMMVKCLASLVVYKASLWIESMMHSSVVARLSKPWL